MTANRSGLATVVAFGDDGWGTLEPNPREGDGSLAAAEIAFHSTAIVDGSRAIEVGARVRYRMVPGRQGRWEASEIEPIGTL